MARRRRAFVTALFAAGAALAAACTVMNGLSVPPIYGGVAPASTEAGGGSRDTCDHAYPPAAPTAFVEGDTQTILVAARSMDAFPPDGGAPFGYDVDGLCTCTGGAPEACASDASHCDDPRGRDDAFAGLLGTLDALGIHVLADVQTRLSQGRIGVLLQIERYNGLADDSDVRVSIFPSDGTFDPDAGVPDGGPLFDHPPPRFDATDQWALDSTEVSAGPSARPVSDDATTGYVSNFMVVASIDTYLEIVPSEITILKQAQFTAQIVPAGDGTFTISEAVLVGRWPTSELIKTVGLFATSDGGALCESPAFPALALGAICPVADLTLEPSSDNKGNPCDAISMALHFTMAPASFGPIVSPTTAGPGCLDAGPLTCN